MFWEGAGLLLEPGGRWMLLSPGCPDTASLDGSSPGTVPATGFIKPSVLGTKSPCTKQEERGRQENAGSKRK